MPSMACNPLWAVRSTLVDRGLSWAFFFYLSLIFQNFPHDASQCEAFLIIVTRGLQLLNF